MATKVNPVTGALDYYEQALPPFRNKLINGAMQIAQRGNKTGVTSHTYGGPDRFRTVLNTAGTWSISQSTNVPSGSGFGNSFKLECTSADSSLGVSDYVSVAQYIEGQNLQDLSFGATSAKAITLSFWVKSSVTGTYICEIFQNGASPTRQASKAYTISVANTWEKKTITYLGDQAGTIPNNNTSGLAIIWYLAAGTNFTSGTLNTAFSNEVLANRIVGQVNVAATVGNTWQITGVQLEIGTSATPFEHRPIGTELRLCQRYYEKSDGTIWSSTGYHDSYIRCGQPFLVEKRATPDVNFNNTSNSGGTSISLTVQKLCKTHFGWTADGVSLSYGIVFDYTANSEL